LAAKRKKGKEQRTVTPPEAVTPVQPRSTIDPAIVRRRENAVNRLRADGYTLREIADSLLQVHIKEGSSLFTFTGPDGHPLTPEEVSALPWEELRDRAYNTVKQDVKRHRDEVQKEAPNAVRLADDRYVLAERYRTFLKRIILKMEGDPSRGVPGERDTGRYNNMMRTAIDLAARIGRLQGIETEKPMELRLPERYRAWIDGDGIIHKEKLDASENEEEEKPN